MTLKICPKITDKQSVVIDSNMVPEFIYTCHNDTNVSETIKIMYHKRLLKSLRKFLLFFFIILDIRFFKTKKNTHDPVIIFLKILKSFLIVS